MADDFNLTPTNNLEKHLDNILRTAQGEEPQYDLAPNWRTEQYLAAIASALASGGGGGVKYVDTNDLARASDVAQQVYDDLQTAGSYAFIGWYSIPDHSVCPLFKLSNSKFNMYVTEMMASNKLQYKVYTYTWNSTTHKFSPSVQSYYYTMTAD